MYYPAIRQTNQHQKRSMTVYGISRLAVEPTIAVIQLGVVQEDAELTKAQQNNSNIIQKITQALIKQGISSKHIQTADYSIYPQYDYNDNEQKFRGYQVNHLLSITIENIQQTGNIIDTAVKNGANKVQNIQFSVQNKDLYYNNALRKALNNALSKAMAMAEELKIHLDPIPVKILEQSTEYPSFAAYKSFTNAGSTALSSTAIEPGQLYIEAKVEAHFHCYA